MTIELEGVILDVTRLHLKFPSVFTGKELIRVWKTG